MTLASALSHAANRAADRCINGYCLFNELVLTLGNSYWSAHTDDSCLPGTAPREVEAYSLWDLSASWKVTRSFTLRAGVLNLADAEPPFSNQSCCFLSTYDPTYADPRGCTVFVSARYAF